MKMERRAAELRAGEGRTLIGLAVPFGIETRIGAGRERFEPGSARSTGDAILNVHHSAARPLAREPGTLAFESRADGLHVRATLPETRESADTLALVRSGVLTGLSVEFRADAERYESGVRVIERATVGGLAVVSRAAYPTTRIEARGPRLGEALQVALAGLDLAEAAAVAGIDESDLRAALVAMGKAVPEPVRSAAIPLWRLS